MVTPVQKFIKAESFSGMLLFFVTVLALIIANSGWADWYAYILQYNMGIQSESFSLTKPLVLWINDGLMAVFFFLIGLEIKREILIGELNSMRKACLPIFAAIGGMVIPLLFFLILNDDPATSKGWGITVATDIAFTLAILQLLGKRVPLGLKIFLTAFAIIDDIGAVMVIAVFYTEEVAWNLMLYAAMLLMVLYVLAYLKIHSKYLIFFFGSIVWLLFLKAGVHPTLAGILLAFAVPISQRIDETTYLARLKTIVDRFTSATGKNKLPILSKSQVEEIDNLESWTDKVQSPLQQLEHRLHTWVAFFIMPVFALANAGISFSGEQDVNLNLAVSIAVALFAGKTLGVSLFSYLGLRLKVAELPKYVRFKQVIGVAMLSGVGFTMSLFIGNLAFVGNPDLLNSAKIGVITGSAIAGISGYLLLWTYKR